ncbi:MAG: S41 family peptidase [Bacteroidia bacterium]|nr:S41 family peptidase [Bacteroidia bacterium]
MNITKLLLACFLFSACTNSEQSSYQPLASCYMLERGKTNPEILGLWKSIGNGYLLEAREDSLLLYSYTQSFCYKEKNDYLEGLLNSQSSFRLLHDTLQLYLTDYGEGTENLQTKKDFIRIESLPSPCLTFSEMVQLTPKDQFALYRETMEENYAFQQRRELDWDKLFSSYSDSLKADDSKLFQYMGAIATACKDQHTKIINTEGQSLQYRVTPSALIVQETFEEQNEIKELNQYFNHFFSNNYRLIADSILLGKGKKVLNGKLEWGKTQDNIGYLHIHSFAGFLGREFSRMQQIDSIRKHMKIIIDSLQDTRAMIIDISFNFGGYDASALTIASFFTEEIHKAYDSQVFYDGSYHTEDQVRIYPSKTARYTKDVYLLSTDISRSAAEGFAMMMDALPNVQIVGTPSLGILSGMLGKSIHDYYVTISNQKLLNPAGEYFEANGVAVDIPMEVFKKENVFRGHLEAIKAIGQMSKENE